MGCSRRPGPAWGDGSWPAARTPGSLGFKDQADPELCTLLGDSPGILGHRDSADPTMPGFGALGWHVHLRLGDGAALSMPVGAAQFNMKRAPWMKFAQEQARLHKGAVEGVIEKTSNYHQDLGTGQKTLKGKDHAWCAAFVNWCLKEAGYDVENDDFADRKYAMGRANAFNKVQEKKAKKGEKATLVANPLFVRLDGPVFGAIGMIANREGRGHHVGLVYSRPDDNTIVLLGGNQADTIKFSEYHLKGSGKKADHLEFFVPAIYEATARADSEPLKSDSADTLNEAFGIVSKKKSKGRESTR
jgi:uncharacterized protein (TIGR02594 family)